MSDSVVRVAVVQAAFADGRDVNVDRALAAIEAAAADGAEVVVLPELFEGPYFPKTVDDRYFEWARPFEGHPTIARVAELCRSLEVVVPVSFFERDGDRTFNSVAVVDADGRVLGLYRKSHIPEGPGYEEKYYFAPGDTGFRTWATRVGRIGVGICWDQWFPECARAMTLAGADLLVYPTAIGSEPAAPDLDTRDPWKRVMLGHAVANAVPVAAANRIGEEEGQTFYGCSFVADERGDTLVEMGEAEDGHRIAAVDLSAARATREDFAFFRHRRPDLYGGLVRPRDET